MGPRLIDAYQDELKFLRDMGAEFAQQHPKIAARLGMSGLEVADPYVERLIEAVAFLAARVQVKLDAEFPRFTQALLEIVYPLYLSPTPSMLIAQMKPDPGEPNLATGFTVPRGTTMFSAPASEEGTACEFRTAHDVTLWPVEIASASYFSFAPDLPLNQLAMASRIRGGLRVRLRTTAGVKFSQIGLDRLSCYVTGHDDVANRLYELCAGASLGALVLPATTPAAWHEFIGPAELRPAGTTDDEALLPATLRSFQGYRLLQEYFAFPARYRFFTLGGLQRALRRCDLSEIEIVLLFNRADPSLDRVVDGSNLALFCTPAVNLFHRRTDRIHVSESAHEYHVVPDRTRPMDFEVYQVTSVIGHGEGADSEQEFRPFYAEHSADASRQHGAYFTTRRERRLASSSQQRRGARTSYLGTEVFLSLVDSAQAPFASDLRQLSIQALCTNRDLVLQMPVGSKAELSLDISAPVVALTVVSGPSRPASPLFDAPQLERQGAIAWRAISHLCLNYLSLSGASPGEAATALRDVLDLYAAGGDAHNRRQIEGVRAVDVTPVVRRLPASAGPIAFGRGLAVTVTVDDMAFQGASAFLLGSVLSHFFGRYVSINSFTETALRSETRGEIHRWMPAWGARPTL